jgi:hypothetical protein
MPFQSVLVQYQPSSGTFLIYRKNDFGTYDLSEELIWALRVDLDFRLAGKLEKETVCQAGDCNEDESSYLVETDVSVELLGIDWDRRSWLLR